MEAEAEAAGCNNNSGGGGGEGRRVMRKKLRSSSFSLRCPSLNTLRLRRIFDMFDKNRDGTITGQELGQALNQLGLDVDVSDLHSTINSFITPGNDGLMFDDFKALHQSLNHTYFNAVLDAQQEEELDQEQEELLEDQEQETLIMSQEDSDLTEAFKVFDEDGDGFISAHELQVVLGKLGFHEGNEIDRVQKMITSVDRNHDGRVDFFEFKDMMRTVLVTTALA